MYVLIEFNFDGKFYDAGLLQKKNYVRRNLTTSITLLKTFSYAHNEHEPS